MLLLKDLGAEGLRKKLEEQQRAEPFGVESYGLAGQVRHQSALSRKAKAAAKLQVDAQRHKHLIEAHVLKYYDSEEIRTEVVRHVDLLKNLQRQVTNRVALCYHRPPSRTIRGVDDDQVVALLAAYREAKTDVQAERWNRYAFFLSVVHVLPRYEHGRLCWVTVTPDKADVLFDPIGELEPSILVYETKSHGAKRIAVDSERWWWIGSDWKIAHEEVHGLGMRPWVAIRWQHPPESDYWDEGAGQDLYDGTLELGRVYAHARWVRKHWSKKTATVHKGENVHLPENQNMSANQPVMFHGPGQSKVEVHDTIVEIAGFKAEMREITESVLEGYGLPANVVDFSTGSTEDAANVFSPAKINQNEALVKLRDQQVKHFDDAEIELAVRAVALLRRAGRLAITEEQVRSGFRCRHAPMTFADHPAARVKTAKEQMSIGATNPYEFYMMEHPGVTFEEAREYVDKNVELRAEFYDLWIASNMNLDPSDDLRTAAQLNGKMGGQSKSNNTNESEERQ